MPHCFDVPFIVSRRGLEKNAFGGGYSGMVLNSHHMRVRVRMGESWTSLGYKMRGEFHVPSVLKSKTV